MSRTAELQARVDARARILDDYLTAARRSAELSYTADPCRFNEHSLCDGKTYLTPNADCLCTCHDPEPTYWVLWSIEDGVPQHGGSGVSGPYDTADEAIEGFSAKPSEAAWYREQIAAGRYFIEQVTAERFDALGDWDAMTEQQRAALRPLTGRETA